MNPTTPIVVIVVLALAALILVAALVVLTRIKRNHLRYTAGQTVRDRVREEDRRVTQREALADEADAKARATQAAAGIKTP